jgi:hypothetical protein
MRLGFRVYLLTLLSVAIVSPNTRVNSRVMTATPMTIISDPHFPRTVFCSLGDTLTGGVAAEQQRPSVHKHFYHSYTY